MVRLTPIETHEIHPEARAILDEFHPSPDQAPDFLRVLAGSLTAMKAYFGARSALAHGQLTAGQREQIALAVAEINGSKNCLAAHHDSARKAGLTERDIRLAGLAAATDAKSNAMLGFTMTVVLQRGEVKNEHVKMVRDAGFSDSEIIEIIANIAINIFTNYLDLISKTEATSPPHRSAPQAVGAA